MVRPRRSRPKTAWTWSGRPMPTLSVTSDSKKPRARRGSSKTRVRRDLDLAHGQLPEVAGRLVGVGERVGITAVQRSKKPWTSAGPKRSQIAWRATGSRTGGEAVGQLGEADARRRAWRLAHSWPFSQTLAG